MGWRFFVIPLFILTPSLSHGNSDQDLTLVLLTIRIVFVELIFIIVVDRKDIMNH